MATFFEDIKEYVGFDENDARVLAGLRDVIAPHRERIAEHFYARILAHPQAHAAITGGKPQVERLKRTLQEWMDRGLAGPHDEAFYDLRARIGRRHVKIALPQQYMVTAIDVMRLDYRRVLEEAFADDREAFVAACDSVDKLFDLELAIMLQTYRQDSDERLRRSERLATIGHLAASIGHDLRNPLGVIESSLFILRRRIDDDERATRHVDKIAKQVAACDRIVTDLLDMARNRPPKRVPVDLEQIFEEAIASIPIPSGVRVQHEVEEGLALEADGGLLQQAVVNLVQNSVKAVGGQGNVTVRAFKVDDHEVGLSVRDDGPGFDTDVLPIAFEPLVTTRAKGIGLGLSLVRSVIERHGGRTHARNPADGGALVEIFLPERGTAEKTTP